MWAGVVRRSGQPAPLASKNRNNHPLPSHFNATPRSMACLRWGKCRAFDVTFHFSMGPTYLTSSTETFNTLSFHCSHRYSLALSRSLSVARLLGRPVDHPPVTRCEQYKRCTTSAQGRKGERPESWYRRKTPPFLLSSGSSRKF